jgi:hypothetical protein
MTHLKRGDGDDGGNVGTCEVGFDENAMCWGEMGPCLGTLHTEKIPLPSSGFDGVDTSL